MDLGIEGKVALVLAGSGGLGLACARSLAAEGAKVVINGRDRDRCARAAEDIGMGVTAVVGNINDADQRLRVLQEVNKSVGAPDILVLNNAGPAPGPFLDLDLKDLERTVGDVALSMLEIVQKSVPAMMERGWGRIVSLSSISGKEITRQGTQANFVRPALAGALGTAAREVAQHGVTINSILSGPFDTPGLRKVVQAHGGSDGDIEKALQTYAANGPAGRLGALKEMGALCAFLCSDLSGYLTGQAITLDGGRVATLY